MIIIFVLACGSSEKETGMDDTSMESNIVDTAPVEETASPVEEDPCGWNDVDLNVDPLTLTGDTVCGQEVYLDRCAICHMENGEGSNAGKQLVGFIDQYSDEHLVEVIQEGWGPMPPVAINPQQIADVIVHLRETF